MRVCVKLRACAHRSQRVARSAACMHACVHACIARARMRARSPAVMYQSLCLSTGTILQARTNVHANVIERMRAQGVRACMHGKQWSATRVDELYDERSPRSLLLSFARICDLARSGRIGSHPLAFLHIYNQRQAI